MFGPEALAAFFQVVVIDLVLAGDNAVVIGLAASGLPDRQRNRAIVVGILAATVLRILFASITVTLMAVVGLVLVGGLLLLWVCWKMWRELRAPPARQLMIEEAIAAGTVVVGGAEDGAGRSVPEAAAEVVVRDVTISVGEAAPRKTFAQAATQIVIADVSMSLDNVLAVAGASREHPWVLVFGLMLSIAMMGLAASLIARLLHRWRWIAYVGLALVFYVALKMIFHGWLELQPYVIHAT